MELRSKKIAINWKVLCSESFYNSPIISVPHMPCKQLIAKIDNQVFSDYELIKTDYFQK